jgi:hypothetical protein
MNRGEMRDEVYTRLGETAGFFTDANINQWLNDGMDDIALRLEPKVTSATLSTVANTIEYSLPENLISIKTVLYLDTTPTPDQYVELIETTYLQLFRENPSWENDTVALVPNRWYWRPEMVIGIYPKPETGTTSGLRIIYTCRPDEMDEDVDTTTMWDYLDRVVILYAVMRAREKDRDEKRAIVARAEWTESVAIASTLTNKHRKEHAPRLQPGGNTYRNYWYGRYPRFKAWSA